MSGSHELELSSVRSQHNLPGGYFDLFQWRGKYASMMRSHRWLSWRISLKPRPRCPPLSFPSNVFRRLRGMCLLICSSTASRKSWKRPRRLRRPSRQESIQAHASSQQNNSESVPFFVRMIFLSPVQAPVHGPDQSSPFRITKSTIFLAVVAREKEKKRLSAGQKYLHAFFAPLHVPGLLIWLPNTKNKAQGLICSVRINHIKTTVICT